MPRKKEKQDLNQLKSLLESRLLPVPPGPPQTDEDRYVFYANLVRLKALRLTNGECADKLGVGESTIRKYMADAYYREIRDGLIGNSKDRGHFLISELLDDATRGLQDLMLNAKSEFVRLKAVELTMEAAGLKEPRDTVRQDARDEVVEFLRQVDLKKKQETLQPAQITEEPMIVDSLPPGTSQEMAQYFQMVAPGGGLPQSFKTERNRQREEEDD